MTTREISGEHPTCIGGGRCVCYRGTEHEHCICGDPKCACHAPAAYRLTKAVCVLVAVWLAVRAIERGRK